MLARKVSFFQNQAVENKLINQRMVGLVIVRINISDATCQNNIFKYSLSKQYIILVVIKLL